MDDATFDRLRSAATSVLADGDVAFAYVFGSAVSGRTHPRSDVDIGVHLREQPRDPLARTLELAGRLSSASGVGRIDVVILNDVPISLRGRIVRERRVLFSADEPSRVEFESRTLREFFDFQIHAVPLDRKLLRRTAEGRR